MKTSIKITRLIHQISRLQKELLLLEQSEVEVVDEDRMENEGGLISPEAEEDYISPESASVGPFIKRGAQY